MAEFTFRGLMAPVLTPFKDDMSPNLDIIEDYAKFLANSGVMAVLIHGTSGEGTSMTVQEKWAITEAWIEAAKKTKQHVMVQVGGAPLPDVLEMAKHAEAVGAHSLLCLPELYNKPANSADLIRYLKIVAAAAPKTPLLYYHIPSFTNVNINMAQFLNDIAGKVPNFHGIKFTSSSLDEGISALKANDGKYAVFLGNDLLLAGAFMQGFDSAICTSLNMFPRFGIDILDAVKNSDVAKARKTQEELTKLVLEVTRNGTWVPTMKVAMELFTPIPVGRVRDPLLNLPSDHVKQMEQAVKSFNFKI